MFINSHLLPFIYILLLVGINLYNDIVSTLGVIMWLYLGLGAAFFLGIYNINKKFAVRENGVAVVVCLTSFFICIMLLPVLALRHSLNLDQFAAFQFTPLTVSDHLLLMIKAAIMALSWLLGYLALKKLPITFVAPIRASGPFFTLIGAILLYQEIPNWLQLIGFLLILFSAIFYAQVGKLEGIDFLRNPYIACIIVATLLGAASGLYDKYIIQFHRLSPLTILFWVNLYITIFTGLVIVVLKKYHKNCILFSWRWSILLVSLFLILADFLYFTALQEPDAMISMLSAIKRSQLFITVFLGGYIFKEKNKRIKALPLIGLLIGIILILQAS